MAPIPTPEVLWRKPPALRARRPPGTALGRLGESSTAPPAAWAAASQGDALFDVAILTLGHQEHLGDVVAGYGTDVDRDLIRAWWSLRSLRAVRWLVEHGCDPSWPGCEVDVLNRAAIS